MSDEVGVFVWLELFEDGFEGIADGIEAAWVHLFEQTFDLGEDLFDRVEVGAVGRQVDKVHPCAFEALADTGNLVSGQIIDNDNAARLHLGDQAFLQPLAEDHAVHRAWQQVRGEDAIMRQACDKGGCHPVAMWSLGEELSAFVTPAMAARHRGVGAGLIDKDQRTEVEARLGCCPELARQCDIRPVLLGREYGFF